MSIRYKLTYLIVLINLLLGVSAPPNILEVEQIDNSKIPVRMYGHEYYNWVETIDGYVIQQNDGGGWYYSQLDDNGKYISSNILVTYPTHPDLEISKYLKEFSPKVRKLSHCNKINEHIDEPLGRSGFADETLKPLIMLVDFNDEERYYLLLRNEYQNDHLDKM